MQISDLLRRLYRMEEKAARYQRRIGKLRAKITRLRDKAVKGQVKKGC